jgi:hypothetical protein
MSRGGCRKTPRHFQVISYQINKPRLSSRREAAARESSRVGWQRVAPGCLTSYFVKISSNGARRRSTGVQLRIVSRRAAPPGGPDSEFSYRREAVGVSLMPPARIGFADARSQALTSGTSMPPFGMCRDIGDRRNPGPLRSRSLERNGNDGRRNRPQSRKDVAIANRVDK